MTSRGVKNDDFSIFGDIGGDFYEETHEAKLFGMHIGSVLSYFEQYYLGQTRHRLLQKKVRNLKLSQTHERVL